MTSHFLLAFYTYPDTYYPGHRSVCKSLTQGFLKWLSPASSKTLHYKVYRCDSGNWWYNMEMTLELMMWLVDIEVDKVTDDATNLAVADRIDFTDVTLVSEDTELRLFWCALATEMMLEVLMVFDTPPSLTVSHKESLPKTRDKWHKIVDTPTHPIHLGFETQSI